jgi:protein arginine N-methyltransferase 2
MEATTPEGPDPDLEAQMILLAASQHNLETLRTLLRTGSANVQDPETGYTPLHAALQLARLKMGPLQRMAKLIPMDI